MAADAGKPCVPHSANLSMVTVFAMHLMGAIPNAGPYFEYGVENNSWTDSLYDPPLDVRDGTVMIPDGPGWGVTVNSQWLQSADYRISAIG
jgi:L-alanine-DL-glutamate epimerase-like enolase superfamily enzyme